MMNYLINIKNIIILISIILLSVVNSYSADFIVSQNKKKFSEKKMTVEVGDTIIFKNDDNITHNLYSRKGAKIFEIEKMVPGSEASVLFDEIGKVKIRCAIHPKMKITVNVK